MSVPKCKECECLSVERSIFNPILKYYCENTDNPDTKQLWLMNRRLILKQIFQNEMQTSPKWCPKRSEIQKEGKE